MFVIVDMYSWNGIKKAYFRNQKRFGRSFKLTSLETVTWQIGGWKSWSF